MALVNLQPIYIVINNNVSELAYTSLSKSAVYRYLIDSK